MKEKLSSYENKIWLYTLKLLPTDLLKNKSISWLRFLFLTLNYTHEPSDLTKYRNYRELYSTSRTFQLLVMRKPTRKATYSR